MKSQPPQFRPYQESRPPVLKTILFLLVSGFAYLYYFGEEWGVDLKGWVHKTIREIQWEKELVKHDAKKKFRELKEQAGFSSSKGKSSKAAEQAVEVATTFTAISNVYPSPAEILSNQEDVWLATKYDITRFHNGDPDQPQQLWNPKAYRTVFSSKMSAIKSMAFREDNELWTGSWHGQLLRNLAGKWQELSSENGMIKGPISVIIPWDGEMLIGGFRLWKWRDQDPILRLDNSFNDQGITAWAQDPKGRLLMASRMGLWRLENSRWNLLWRTDKLPIESIFVESHAIFLGTRYGYVKIDHNGSELDRQLKTYWVHCFARGGNNRFWVGTWKDGVLMYENGDWYLAGEKGPLFSNSVMNLHLDSHGQLWVGFYGKGVLVAPEETAATWIKEHGIKNPLN